MKTVVLVCALLLADAQQPPAWDEDEGIYFGGSRRLCKELVLLERRVDDLRNDPLMRDFILRTLKALKQTCDPVRQPVPAPPPVRDWWI